VTVRYVQNSYPIDVEQTPSKEIKQLSLNPHFCDKVSKEMYQFFFSLSEHDVKGRSGKLYSGINILFLPLSLLSLRAEWRNGNERKTHFANHRNQLLIDAVLGAFWALGVHSL